MEYDYRPESDKFPISRDPPEGGTVVYFPIREVHYGVSNF